MANKVGRRTFGSIRQRYPSAKKASERGSFRADYSYLGERWAAPSTFTTRQDAEAWLIAEQKLISSGLWTPPAERQEVAMVTFGQYAEDWLNHRIVTRDLQPKTVAEYRRQLEKDILPGLGDRRLVDITPTTVRRWRAKLPATRKSANFHEYVLVKSILESAVQDGMIAKNPCVDPAKRPARDIAEPPTIEELAIIVAAMPERLQLMVELAAWNALRFGEVAELRRKDVDLEHMRLRIERQVQWVDGKMTVKAPKADSGRVVYYPPHMHEAIVRHLDEYTEAGRNALLFPTTNGGQYRPPTFHRAFWRKARAEAGREDLRFHDLRHFGMTIAAMSGATLAELKERAGHRTFQAAVAYQHAAQGSGSRVAADMASIALAAKREKLAEEAEEAQTT